MVFWKKKDLRDWKQKDRDESIAAWLLIFAFVCMCIYQSLPSWLQFAG
jgi:hypothetical protein